LPLGKVKNKTHETAFWIVGLRVLFCINSMPPSIFSLLAIVALHHAFPEKATN